MGQCLDKVTNLIEESEPAPHSFKASIRANETAKATHKGNLLLTDSEIRFYENKQVHIYRGVGAILNKNTNFCMAFIIHGEIRYTFGVITYNFYLFTVLPSKISSNIIHLNTNGVF